MMTNAFGFERGVPSREKGDCARCDVADAMDDSRYCESCAEHMASLTA